MKRRIAILLTVAMLLGMTGFAEDLEIEDEIIVESDDNPVDEVGLEIGDIGLSIDDIELSVENGIDGAVELAEDVDRSNASEDFDIQDGVLVKYKGPGGDVVIPDGVKYIITEAFRNCTKICSVKIPTGVTGIGGSAFSGCTSLKKIAIASSVTSIGPAAFEYCSSLTSIKIPSRVTGIEWLTFRGCGNLTSVRLPSGVTSIKGDAFEGCSSLTSIKIPSKVTSIGENAFHNCSSLTNITIPSRITCIESGTFAGCSSLTGVKIPSGVTSIGGGAFSGCSSLTSITIPSGVTSIGLSAFSDCSSLTSIKIPSRVTGIEALTFSGCSSLINVKIPSGVAGIGRQAFSECTSLTSIKIPSSVTSIGSAAFMYCSSLTSVTIPSSVTSIEFGAFAHCTSLKGITLPSSITSIENYIFNGCSSLTSITIPSGATGIGHGAFSGCTGLFSAAIPPSITSISDGAFFDCPNLTIYGEAGSYAETYANKEDIPFVVGSPTSTGSPKLASKSPVIGVREQFSLIAADSPISAAQCNFKSKSKSIATVNKNGVVTGLKAGKSTTITVTPTGGKAIKVKVTVMKAPSKVTVKPKEVELEVGRGASLMAKLPSKTASAIKWTSSDQKVATVDSNGIVMAVATGTATITATTFNNKSDTCKVVVPKLPTKISIIAPTKSVEWGKTLQLDTKIKPSDAKALLKWESDNSDVAIVDGNGLVTARARGTANITVITSNGKQDTVKITVKKNPVEYRALLVGQVNYDEKFAAQTPSCAQDVKMIRDMLNSVEGASGGKFAVTVKRDLSYKQFKAAIKSAFKGADDNDVSLLFYSGHGAQGASAPNEGALCMVPRGVFTLQDLADNLRAVPGKIIIILNSCGSGTAIYQEGVAENSMVRQSSASFNARVIDVFASNDPGINEDSDGSIIANPGELAIKAKFYVLTATRRDESASTDPTYSSPFPGWLTDGVSFAGAMPADTDGDSTVTLYELYKYIKKASKGFDKIEIDGEWYPVNQHVQIYPKKSNFKLFKRDVE